MITPSQSRAGRGLLGWTQADLARASSVSTVSINNFENGQEVKRDTLLGIQTAFDRHSIEFPDSNTVRRRQEGTLVLKGKDALTRLWEDIFFTLKDKGGEVLITYVDEKRTLEIEGDALTNHLKRLKKHKITERLLSQEGDTCFLMPKSCYRWISKELFTASTSTYVYADKVALQLWGDAMIVLIQSQEASQAEKRRFEYLWERAQIPN